MANIKKNFFYSSILTTANYIFPFITYPYVSRVLGVEKIGICNFVDSIINYFILFSMLGISILGIREIAKCKKNTEELNRTFSSIFFLNSISTSLTLIILIIATITLPQLYNHKELMFIGALKLIFNYLLVEWLYKGLEDFKFITTRTIIVKCIYVISVFSFIHEAKDYKLYYFILSMMVIVNAIINIIYSRKVIHLTLKGLNIKQYVKPFIMLGMYTLLTSMYTSFNVAYLGFTGGEIEVGYYTTATKLYSILLSIFTAFTGVMLPRMSSLVSEKRFDEFRNLSNKSINMLLGISIPLILFSTIFSQQIIQIISGKGYEGAIIPMQIVMPLMLIIGYEQIIVIQTLMPLRKDKIILINSIIGASIGIIFNVLLVSEYKSIGSAITWVCSEVSVLIIAQYFVQKYIQIKFPIYAITKNIIYNIPLGVCLYFMSKTLSTPINIIGAGILFILYSIILQVFILKNENFTNIFKKLLKIKN